MEWSRRLAHDSKRELARGLFDMYEAVPEILEGSEVVFDASKQLWRTTDGRPVLSRHFVDYELLISYPRSRLEKP
jgi:hypothetical protein